MPDHESNDRLHPIFESSGTASLLIDEDLTIIQVNSQFEEVFGYKREDIAGTQNWTNFVHPDDLPMMFAYHRQRRIDPESVPPSYEFRCFDRWGRVRYVLAVVSLIPGTQKSIASIIDITENKRISRVQEATYKISNATHSVRSLDELYLFIHKTLGELMPVENIFIALYDPTKDLLSFSYFVDQIDDAPLCPIKPGRSMTGYVLRTGKPLLAPPEIFIQLVNRGEVELVGVDSVDWVGVPLIVDGHTIGVMALQSYREDVRFGVEELRILTFVSDQVAMAIERKRSEEAEHEERKLAEALHDITSGLNSTLLFEEVLDRILTSVGRVVPHDALNIMLIEGVSVRVARSLANGEHQADVYTRNLRLNLSDVPILNRIAGSGQPMIIRDSRIDPEWIDLPDTRWIRSMASAPILIKGQVIGFLNLNSAEPDFYSNEHIERLKKIANQAALAIENARLFEETQQRARDMALLNDITRAALETSGFQAMLQTMADRIGVLFEADNCFITLWDETTGQVLSGAACGVQREQYPALRPSIGEITMTESVLRAGHALVVSDVSNTPLLSPRIATLFPSKSHLGLPLISGDQKLGAALISYESSHTFTDREIALGEQAAGQVALAIAKARLLEAERQQSARLRRSNSLINALGHVATRIVKAHDPDDVFAALGAELRRMSIHCLIALKLSDSPALTIRYLSVAPEILRMIEKLFGAKVYQLSLSSDSSSLYNELIEQHRVMFMTDPLKAVMDVLPGVPVRLIQRMLWRSGTSPMTKIIFLPLYVEGRPIGGMWLWGEDLRESDMPAAAVFSSQVAIALENARLYAEVQRLAITDSVTGVFGVYNRRGLSTVGQREMERARRYMHPLAAIMLDIDHFKLVNDCHSHAIGDQVLIELARRCCQNIRDTDILARYGGEEFILLLPETDLGNAFLVAERLRECIAAEPVSTDHGQISVTISLGIAMLSDSTSNLAMLMDNADRAMYIAKRSGRNRVAIEGEDQLVILGEELPLVN